MGEGFLRKRGEHFKHSSEKQYLKLKEVTLQSAARREVHDRHFRCTTSVQGVVQVGMTVLVRSVGNDVEVICGNQTVAQIERADLADARAAISLEPLRGLSSAVVEDVSDFTGDFKVRLVETTDANTK